MKKLLIVLNSIMFAIGGCGGPLIMRLYFIHGGARLWLSSFLQSAGSPIMLIPLIAAYIKRRKTQGSDAKLIHMNRILFLASIVVGCIAGFDAYLYSYGVEKLPVSTSTLIMASQLVFTAFFAFLLVKQKFTAYSINAVVLLTIGSAVLALDSSSDRPEGESKKDYILGFVLTLAAAALYGLVYPLIELAYVKAKMEITYTVVMEFQMVFCFFASVFCMIGMGINNDFKVIPREAREFELGESKYYFIMVCSAIAWQCYYVGAVGVVFYASALFSGVLGSALLPIVQIFSVVLYHEKFQSQKIVSLILSLWGSASYIYGEKKQNEKENQIPESKPYQNSSQTEMAVVVAP